MVSPDPKQRSARSATILLVLSTVGLVLHLVITFYPNLNIVMLAPAITWVIELPKSKNPFNVRIRPYSSC